jgi:glyoxylase I family protein
VEDSFVVTFNCIRRIFIEKLSTEAIMAIEMRGICTLLQVFDMPTSIHFYRDVLGFEIVGNSPMRSTDDYDWVWLRYAETEIMLNTAYEFDSRPESIDTLRIAAHDDTCLYIGCLDVDAAYSYLRAKGFELKEPKVTHYGMKQLYLKDPDGYGVCFQWKA